MDLIRSYILLPVYFIVLYYSSHKNTSKYLRRELTLQHSEGGGSPMSFKSLRFYQTPGVQALQIVHLNVAASLIANHFAGKEDFLVFKYMEGKTVITDGNDVILANFDQRLFSHDVWAVYGEELDFCYYTFMTPSEY
jgi:hypothetical protein